MDQDYNLEHHEDIRIVVPGTFYESEGVWAALYIASQDSEFHLHSLIFLQITCKHLLYFH